MPRFVPISAGADSLKKPADLLVLLRASAQGLAGLTEAAAGIGDAVTEMLISVGKAKE